jgi:hypothetical protein
MKKRNTAWLAVFVFASLLFSSCLHIVEDVTFRKNGSGSYIMTIDMSEIKGMMDMFKGMNPTDSLGVDSTAIITDGLPAEGPNNEIGQLGQEMANVTSSLKGLPGISNVLEINDTSAYSFGYSFDFADVAALNRAMKVINKEKYDAKTEEVFKFKGGNFERLSSGNLGEELKKALDDSNGEDSGEEGLDNSMEMMKMFFSEMSYKQVYHFPDQEIKKNSNELGELSDDNHTLSITLKPFDEEQKKKNVDVSTKVKLK